MLFLCGNQTRGKPTVRKPWKRQKKEDSKDSRDSTPGTLPGLRVRVPGLPLQLQYTGTDIQYSTVPTVYCRGQ